jgi:hypothetical protein
VKLARLRRSITAYSSTYADYRPQTNAVISWNTGQAKGRSCMGEIRQGKETKNLNVVDVLTVQE